MDNNLQVTNHDFLIYEDDNNKVKVDVLLFDKNIWLNQEQISKLFNKAKSTINEHIKNIYEEKELVKDQTMRKFGNSEFTTKPTNFYNLDMIIAIGYRVKSTKGTQFRKWATKILKEYLITGVVMDDERLKNPEYIFGEDYFERTLERIRNIRSSERRFYQKITDIYATSVDYDKDSKITKDFFKVVQNKLHYAATGYTAAEIIYNRVDSKKKNLGLTNWKESPNGPIYKYDVDIAKNYLDEKELDILNRIVVMYLDYAEFQAKNHNAMTMEDWIEKLDSFLKFNGRDILKDSGKISQKIAQELAYKEYDKYRIKQDKKYISDYDRFIEEIKLLEKKEND